MNLDKYEDRIANAVAHFWKIRNKQGVAGKSNDQGHRGAVTGGKQLDGIVELMSYIAKDNGIPESWVHSRNSTLPGFFRPTKNWDLLIISDQQELIAVLECKSQITSFGNNYNNRTEEALGSAIDLWTAYRENGYGDQVAPWLGYLTLIGKNEASMRPVTVKSPHFDARDEFTSLSYLERYNRLCMKLISERHYTAACVLATEPNQSFENLSDMTSIQTFLRSFIAHINSRV